MSELSIPYEPRDLFIPYHQRSKRWGCIVAHRRAGKTVACVAELTTRATYTSKKNPRYGYIAPFYRQAKEIAWRYLKEMTAQLSVKVMESTLTVELFNGSLIQLFGADNPDALRGLYFDGVVLDEYGDMKPSLWGEVVLPTLADRRGWAVFIGTPKGRNHFYDIHQTAIANPDSWFSLTLRASETGILPDEELAQLKAQMSDEQYSQEMECDFFAAVAGTYYTQLINTLLEKGQIDTEEASYDAEHPVFVASDLGYTDSSAYWFWQERPDGLAIINYYEADSKPLSHYFAMLDSMGYEYDKIWLPHDARAKTLQTGRSTVEQFLDQDYPVEVIPKLDVQDGIEAVRLILPRCHFSPLTGDGVACLREYRRKYDEALKVFSDNPLHNWASHGADAFRGLALVAQQRIIAAKPQKKAEPEPGRLPVTLEQLFQDHERLSLNRRRIW